MRLYTSSGLLCNGTSEIMQRTGLVAMMAIAMTLTSSSASAAELLMIEEIRLRLLCQIQC
ncbi:hypothetical protein [Granulosicoccus antarcticus]|uniref:hypothetical protein n=1 Tax=Granulosicoccus antarcticus TaxID=437505 RepID=UPI0012FE7685|nr:hypothetical protein [Granulosicoccus antarcticus]